MLQNPQTVAFLARVSAKVVDGTIVLMAVLGSLSYKIPGNLALIATVVASLLAVVLAHTYAETINEVIKQRRVVPWHDLRPMFVKQTWVMSSTLVPVAFFGLALLGIITRDKAFRLTEIALVIVLFSFGFLARRLCGGGTLRATSYGAVAVVLGLILVEIKQWAKYLPEIGQ